MYFVSAALGSNSVAEICLDFDQHVGSDDVEDHLVTDGVGTDYHTDADSTNPGEAEDLTDDNTIMLKLISIQSFDGSFQMDAVLAQLLNTTLEDIVLGTDFTVRLTFHY